MRKVDPDTAFRRFDEEADFLSRLFADTSSKYSGIPAEDSYRSKLAELCFHKLYVSYEIYASDLFVGLVNRDSSQYQTWLHGQAVRELQSKLPMWLLTRMTFKSERHIKVENVRMLLDPKDYNVSFRSAKDMQRSAKRWLTPDNSAGILGISSGDRDLINCAVALRNFIAHESPGSLKTMNNQLKKVDKTGENPGLQRSHHEVRSVGSYLKARVGRSPRFMIFSDRLRDIAGTMKTV